MCSLHLFVTFVFLDAQDDQPKGKYTFIIKHLQSYLAVVNSGLKEIVPCHEFL